MGRYGFGFGRTRFHGTAFDTSLHTMPVIAPAQEWDGSAGSGFAGASGPAPSDPLRVTAKPALRLITPPNQVFTDEIVVGVSAFANNGGSLFVNCGLARVICHFEGRSVDIPAPSIRSFTDTNGETVSYLGWWATLKRPQGHTGEFDEGHVYFEAVPADPSMQRRVIGPYTYLPSSILHDYEIEIAPSQGQILDTRYTGFDQPMARAKALGKKSIRFVVTESDSGQAGGKYTISDNGVDAHQHVAWCTIEATVPITIGKSQYTSDSAALQYAQRLPLRLAGANVTFDFLYVNEIYPGRPIWLDGCTLTMNGEGRDQLRRGVPAFPNVWSIRHGFAWYTETIIHDLQHPCAHALLARGVKLTNVGGDIFTDAHCVIGCTVDGHSNESQNTDRPAFTVTYQGAEATATLERSGGVGGFAVGGATGGIWSANWGSNSADFATGTPEAFYNGSAGDGYWMSDVVDWLNALPGWSATLIDDRFAAAYGSLPGLFGRGFGPNSLNQAGSGPNIAADVKDNLVEITAYYDGHGDFYQQNNMFQHENVVIADNLAWQMEAQGIFLSPTGGSAANVFQTHDYVVINNALHFREDIVGGWNPDSIYSQLGRNDVDMSHVVIAHNSLANQAVAMRTDSSNLDFDGFCLIANNVAADLAFNGTADPDLVISDNHLWSGAAGTADVGETKGGTSTTLFTGAGLGQFIPAGDLALETAAPVLRYDARGLERQPVAAKGAIA